MAADAGAIARAQVEGWRRGYAGLVDAGYLESLDPEARAAVWRDILADATAGAGAGARGPSGARGRSGAGGPSGGRARAGAGSQHDGAVPANANAGADAHTTPTVDVLVAEHEHGHEQEPAVAGFVSLAVPARDLDERATGEVTALYVHPDRWRQGIGRALMDAAAARLREQGCDAAVLWVYEANARGRAFYAALGFEPDGARTVDARTGVPEVRLRARLD